MKDIDFLGIGVQKSATSWLHKNLKNHENIWLPPRKELHYFDRSLSYPSPSFLAEDSIFKRLFSNKEHNKLYRKKVQKEFLPLLKQEDKSIENILWYYKYFFQTPNEKWYRSLFPKTEEKICGEITPAYSILSRTDIENIKKFFPKLKIILILRDPIDRAWSQLRFYATRNQFSLDSDVNEITEFIDKPIVTSRGDYINILKNWTDIFPKDQIFIGFYDEIEDDNHSFLTKIFEFLNVDQAAYNDNYQNKIINKSIDEEIPREVELCLAKKYLNDLKLLEKQYPEPVVKWRQKAEKIIMEFENE